MKCYCCEENKPKFCEECIKGFISGIIKPCLAYGDEKERRTLEG